MARTPKPWYWKERSAWYATIGGKRHLLDADEKKAKREFYRIMAAGGQLDQKEKERVTVAVAVEAMLASAQHLRPATTRSYLHNLGPFAAAFEKRRLDSVRPEELIEFVSNYQGTGRQGRPFGDSSRALLFRYVKALFRWAKDTGLIQVNPMHGKKPPWMIAARERVMTDNEYALVMGHKKVNARFKEVLELLWRTGARPGEIAAIQARHLDASQSIVRLQPTEHKTGTRTGLQREVYVPSELMKKLRGYAVDRPHGELLRRMNGKPWTQRGISSQWGYWKKKLGLPADCVIYLARHAFGTRAIDAGNPMATVAKIMGHNDTKTLMKHYFHPDKVAMSEAVEKL